MYRYIYCMCAMVANGWPGIEIQSGFHLLLERINYHVNYLYSYLTRAVFIYYYI